MKRAKLESLPKETLIKIIQMYAKNWMMVDGLWFQGVEDKYGVDVATELDLRIWQRQAVVEVKRIKEVFNITDNSLATVLEVIDSMTWSVVFSFEVEEIAANRAIIYYPHCPMQEARVKQGRGEFPCQPIGQTIHENSSQLINPTAKVKSIFCPPGSHPQDCWCKWEITIET